MRSKMILAIIVSGLMVSPATVGRAVPMGTVFTFQGRLMDANSAADGEYDFEFILYDDPCTGNQQGSTLNKDDVDVIDGYFTAELDFGSDVFNGDGRWLETAIRPGASVDGNDFITLSPRQEIGPTPYALYALSGPATDWNNLINVPAGFLDGLDNDTFYTAGEGLLLSDTTFTADTSYLQRRVASYCPVGTFIRGIEANGNVVCGPDHDTLYTAGEGLLLSDTTFAFSTSWGDSRYVNKAGDTMSGSLFVNANVGIGTTTPTEKLDVAGNVRANAFFGDGSNLTGIIGSSIWSVSGPDIYYNSGNVGIGTSSPPRKLFVNGDAGGSTAWYNDSDARLKKDVATIDDALEKVGRLRGVEFEWKEPENHAEGRQIGFIGQETAKVVPEVVNVKDGNYSMQYAPLTALLVEAVKDQQKQIEAMQGEIDRLKEQIKNQ